MAAQGDPVIAARFPLSAERLSLRPLRMADLAAMGELLADAEVTASLAIFSAPPREQELKQWIEGAADQAAAGRDFRLGIYEITTDRLVGNIGLHPYPAAESADFGYWLGRPFWGQGYASEAAWMLLTHARALVPSLRRVTATTAMDNPASVRLLLRQGFREAGEKIRVTAEGEQRRSRYFERDL